MVQHVWICIVSLSCGMYRGWVLWMRVGTDVLEDRILCSREDARLKYEQEKERCGKLSYLLKMQ